MFIAMPHQATPCAPRRVFSVEIERPDGSHDVMTVEGGLAFDHAIDAMERAGACAVVRVTQIPQHVGEPS
jgi:hypothetical protein